MSDVLGMLVELRVRIEAVRSLTEQIAAENPGTAVVVHMAVMQTQLRRLEEQCQWAETAHRTGLPA